MLKNLSLRFDALEDRILLRLVSDEGEQQLQLTRRVCARWGQDLQQLVATSAQAPARLDAVAQTNLAAAHHQAMAAQATTYRETAPETPLPALSPPQLVTGIACGRRHSDGRWLLRFTAQQGRDWTVVLTSETLHGLVDVFRAQVNIAQWALPPMALEAVATVQAGASPLH